MCGVIATLFFDVQKLLKPKFFRSTRVVIKVWVEGDVRDADVEGCASGLNSGR